MTKKKNKVLLVGWDAADWKIINPLLDSGQMPALKRLIEKGVMGNIATMDPPLSPMLWTSIATGMTADKHGILGFVEPDPSTGKIRPVSVTSRKVKAVWNILMQEGYKVHTVGWWPSHPAEPLNGVSVSNYFVSTHAKKDAENIRPEFAVHPPELREKMESYIIAPNEITFAHLLPFVPLARSVDQEKDKALGSIAALLAKTSSYHAAATWILENQEWDFLGLYMNELDVFCHTFIKYAPPKQDSVDEKQYEIYRGVIDSVYRFYDMMLERLMELVGEETTIVLVSDHGFFSGDQRKQILPNDPVAPAFEHAPYGIFCMAGPGIKKDERIYGTTLLDVAPTILNLFGLPAGEDMQGKVLANAFESADVPKRIESWEKIAGECGIHPGEMREDPWAAKEALEQLIELGYLEAPGEDEAAYRARVTRESKFYLARVHIMNDQHQKALPLLESIYAESPEVTRYGIRLIQCYLRLHKNSDAHRTIDEMRSRLKNGEGNPSLDHLEGRLLLSEHKPRLALEKLKSAANFKHTTADVPIQIGQAYLRLREWENAAASFARAIELDHESARAHHGLAFASLRLGDLETAVDEALTAVGILHHFPAAHYHLGEALMRMGDHANAVRAFTVCLSLRPEMKKAHLWLAQIHETYLPDPEKAELHRKFAKEHFKETIYVVSGLPRSGTSMMMQMLKAGGMDVLTDAKRESDINNPKGYLEDERVKKLQSDTSWLAEAVGKTIKVVTPIVMSLPMNYNYKIIFMDREMEEVLTSQQLMLGRRNDAAVKNYPVALADAFNKQLEKTKAWFASQPHVSVLNVKYIEVIETPRTVAENICSFLELDLDPDKMASAVDGALYRNRK